MARPFKKTKHIRRNIASASEGPKGQRVIKNSHNQVLNRATPQALSVGRAPIRASHDPSRACLPLFGTRNQYPDGGTLDAESSTQRDVSSNTAGPGLHTDATSKQLLKLSQLNKSQQINRHKAALHSNSSETTAAEAAAGDHSKRPYTIFVCSSCWPFGSKLSRY